MAARTHLDNDSVQLTTAYHVKFLKDGVQLTAAADGVFTLTLRRKENWCEASVAPGPPHALHASMAVGRESGRSSCREFQRQ